MTRADYHADPDGPTLSASIAKILLTDSPRHAWMAHPKLNPEYQREEKGAFDIGTAVHAMLLEGEEKFATISVDNWRTKAAQEFREAVRLAGQIPLLEREADNVRAMVASARAQLAEYEDEPFTNGKPEVWKKWEDSGVQCRGLFDWLWDDLRFIDDYKTTAGSAKPERWERTMYGLQGDVQAAFYLRGVLPKVPTFRWIVQEIKPPYALSVCTLSSYGLDLANRKVDTALAAWKECLSRGVEAEHWPMYPRGVYEINPPSWEESSQLTRELAGDTATGSDAMRVWEPL